MERPKRRGEGSVSYPNIYPRELERNVPWESERERTAHVDTVWVQVLAQLRGRYCDASDDAALRHRGVSVEKRAPVLKCVSSRTIVVHTALCVFLSLSLSLSLSLRDSTCGRRRPSPLGSRRGSSACSKRTTRCGEQPQDSRTPTTASTARCPRTYSTSYSPGAATTSALTRVKRTCREDSKHKYLEAAVLESRISRGKETFDLCFLRDSRLFASPLNASLGKYCSLHPSLDRHFGARGSFFSFSPREGCFEATPPFVFAQSFVWLRLLDLLEKAQDAGKALCFVHVIPESVEHVQQRKLPRARYASTARKARRAQTRGALYFWIPRKGVLRVGCRLSVKGL